MPLKTNDGIQLKHILANIIIIITGPIERQSVQLTQSVFHESTIAALKFYGSRGHLGFTNTATFLEVILSWWKSVNVKSKFLSHRKRDDLRAPITSQNLLEKTSFFRGFVDWLQAWGESTQTSRTGLTKETFQASKQTSEGLAGLSEFLILERKMNYFLTGKCQSDKIEGRFGQMRQMSGGNLYASVRQFLESDHIPPPAFFRVKAYLIYFKPLGIILSVERFQCRKFIHTGLGG